MTCSYVINYYYYYYHFMAIIQDNLYNLGSPGKRAAKRVLLLLYRTTCVSQQPSSELEDFARAKVYYLHALAHGKYGSAFGLWRRR